MKILRSVVCGFFKICAAADFCVRSAIGSIQSVGGPAVRLITTCGLDRKSEK